MYPDGCKEAIRYIQSSWMHLSLPIPPTAKGHSRMYCGDSRPGRRASSKPPPWAASRTQRNVAKQQRPNRKEVHKGYLPFEKQKGFHATSWSCDVQTNQNHCRRTDSSNGTTQRKNKRQAVRKRPSGRSRKKGLQASSHPEGWIDPRKTVAGQQRANT